MSFCYCCLLVRLIKTFTYIAICCKNSEAYDLQNYHVSSLQVHIRHIGHNKMSSVTKSSFGQTKDGKDVDKYADKVVHLIVIYTEF